MAHGKSVGLASIPARTVEVVHEHVVSMGTATRFKGYGNVPNRKNRRAYARGRGVSLPAPTLLPYEAPKPGTSAFDDQARLISSGAVPVYR